MKKIQFQVHVFLENRKRINNNFFIHLCNLICKIVMAGVRELDWHIRGNVLNGSHDWC